MKTIKTGVVGCGYWGPNLIRNLRQSPDCKLKLICDARESRLHHMRSLYSDIVTTPCFDDLIASDVEAVVIATPVRFHFEMARACLAAGKHVFIEKPMTRTEAEAEELVALADRQGLVLMVGHTFLFSPAVRRMKEFIDAGDIGEVLYVSARRLNLGLCQKDINVVWDLAPHDLSIILHLLDDLPTTVSCLGSSHITRGIEDITMMYLDFPRDRCALIQNSWLDPKKVRQMTIVGSQRMIAYDDNEPLEKLKIFDTRVEAPPHYDTFAEFAFSYHHGDVRIPRIKQEEPLKLECQHFLECVRENIPPLTGGLQGLQVVRILQAAEKSLQQGGMAMPFSVQPERDDYALYGGPAQTNETSQQPSLAADCPA